MDEKLHRREPPSEGPHELPSPRRGPEPLRPPLSLAVPSYPLRYGHLLPPLDDPASPATEQYRAIKLRLEFLARSNGKPIKTIVVTSPCPQDGKTVTALSLSLVLAQDDTRSVLLIDGDLRKPGIVSYFAHRHSIGLVEVLDREATLNSALFRPEGSRLFILPSGPHARNPAELLGSDRMAQFLARRADEFDQIIIDTPPIVPFVDAAAIASHADASLVIVRSGWTPKKSIAKAIETMSRHNLLGVVLNDLRPGPVDRYYYGYEGHYYNKKSEK